MLTCGSAHVGVIAAMVPSTTVMEMPIWVCFVPLCNRWENKSCTLRHDVWPLGRLAAERYCFLININISVVNNRLRMRPHIYIGRL